MDKVRFGLIGIGNMGAHHAGYLNTVEGATLAAICDVDSRKREQAGQKHQVPVFENYEDLLNCGQVDAVLVATPHYFHPPITRLAFAKGLHVLSEKPVAVTVGEARKTNELYASKYAHLKFGAMFQTRTVAMYRKLRQLIADGELGQISRITWLCTDWYRTWTYYASGGWRATWSGEGGGVLLNQNPHNLDLLQWLIDMVPARVTAVASIAKTHPIEVEDEVSAILEYANGAVGHFITSSGEAPGTNRLEIAGDRGRIVAENGKLHFRRTRVGVKEHLQTCPESFATPECWDIDIPVWPTMPEGHKTITQNFVNAILKEEPMIAPGTDGVKGLEIGNAMLMSGVTRKAVELPMDAEAYEQLIKDLTRTYGGKKVLQTKSVQADMGASFKK